MVTAPTGLTRHVPSRRYREHATKLVRYGTVSLICTTLSLVCLAILVGLLALSPSWSNAGVVLCLTPLSFELNRRWVWAHTEERLLRHAAAFFAFSLAGLALSTVAVHGAARVTSESSRPLRTAAVGSASLSAFGLLWLAQYVFVDQLVFRPRTAADWEGLP
jgi:putative flippase GtrA